MAGLEEIELKLAGNDLTFIGVDFKITLLFSNSSSVQLESPFVIRDAEGDVHEIDPEGNKSALVHVLRLHNQSVESAAITGSTLRLVFSDGSALDAAPNEQFESWSYTGPEPTPARIIAIPGGDLATWLPKD